MAPLSCFAASDLFCKMINKTNNDTADEGTFCGEEFKMTTLIITLAVFAAVTGIADHIYELNVPQMEELPDLR